MHVPGGGEINCTHTTAHIFDFVNRVLHDPYTSRDPCDLLSRCRLNVLVLFLVGPFVDISGPQDSHRPPGPLSRGVGCRSPSSLRRTSSTLTGSLSGTVPTPAGRGETFQDLHVSPTPRKLLSTLPRAPDIEGLGHP